MENNDFSSIDDLPVNPQKSGQEPIVDNINNTNQTNAIQDSLDFPEDFKTDLTNIIIDKEASPTYSNEKENINEEKKVRFNLPENKQEFNENDYLDNLYVNKLSNSYNKLNPLMQIVILSSILFFIMLNPLVFNTIIKMVNKLNIIKLTGEDENLTLTGKVFLSIIFGITLFSLIQFIHSSSLQFVF